MPVRKQYKLTPSATLWQDNYSQYSDQSVLLDKLHCTQLSVLSQHGSLLIAQPESRKPGDCTHCVSGYMPRLHALSVLMGVHWLHQPVLCIFFLLLWVCAPLNLKTRMRGNVAPIIGFLRIPGCCLVQMFVLKLSLRNWIILLCQLQGAYIYGVRCSRCTCHRMTCLVSVYANSSVQSGTAH